MRIWMYLKKIGVYTAEFSLFKTEEEALEHLEKKVKSIKKGLKEKDKYTYIQKNVPVGFLNNVDYIYGVTYYDI